MNLTGTDDWRLIGRVAYPDERPRKRTPAHGRTRAHLRPSRKQMRDRARERTDREAWQSGNAADC